MFSPSGRRLAWEIGSAMTIGPLVLMLARREELEANGASRDATR
jgi:hypothetical protein